MKSDTGTVDLDRSDVSAEPEQVGRADRGGAGFAGRRPAAPAQRGQRVRRHRLRDFCGAGARGAVDRLHHPGSAAGVGAHRAQSRTRVRRELVDRRRGLLGAARGLDLQSPRSRSHASLQSDLGDARRRHPSHARRARRGARVLHRSVQHRWSGAADRRRGGRPLGRHGDQGTDRPPHPARDRRRRSRRGRGRFHSRHPQSDDRRP